MAKHSKKNKPKHAGIGSEETTSHEKESASGGASSDDRAEASAEGEAAESDASEEGESVASDKAGKHSKAGTSGKAEKADEAESADAEESPSDTSGEKAAERDKADEASEKDEAEAASAAEEPDSEDTAKGAGTDDAKAAEDAAKETAKDADDAKDKKAKSGKHAAAADASSDEKKKKGKKKSKGKHSAAHADKHAQPVIQSVPMPAFGTKEDEEKARKRRKRLKVAGISVGSVAAVCLLVYLGGALFFATHYLPNTTVAGIDISLKSPAEMQELLDDSVDEYSVKVVGNGLNFTVTSDEANISADSAAAADAVLKSTNFWTWPVQVLGDHDLTSELSNAISADKLSELVKAEVAKVNDSPDATLPVDAHVAYNEKNHQFEVIAETMGTKLNEEEVMNQVITGVINLEPKVSILSDALVQPEVFANDKRLAVARETANEMVRSNIEILIGGYTAAKVNADVSNKWVTFTPEIEAKFSDEALTAWANELAAKCNTVGAERTYTRPDGKQITVSGGVYGWEVDSSGLAAQIIEAVHTGKNATIEIPVIQAGSGYTSIGGQDWGKRYVDVDLSEQYARFYGDDGAIIWEAPIVSGRPGNGHGTPQGVWTVNRKASPSKLIGERVNGKPEYETVVQYWMPFQGNAIGFHDATWQPYFGGSLYLSNGSHGCINLSYNSAQSLYGILNEGDVVVVHY